MTPADAAELLTLAAAFDRRTIGEADALAWGAALHSVPLDDDTRAAVARHYAETDRWITPAHVITQRRKIRAARIDAANVFYDGRPDETPAEGIARKRAMTAAVASGQVPPQTVRQAVTTAPGRLALDGPPAPEVAARLAALGRQIPAEAADRLADYRPRRAEREALAASDLPDPLNVACPHGPCRARPGEPCRNMHRAPRRTPHPSRLDLAAADHYATNGATT
ncbi:hypothetical protein PV318_03160 [Streptomyces sp. ME02-6991-2B]|nr:hypothetical protein [Streptomyces sp. ME02-6991-2B]